MKFAIVLSLASVGLALPTPQRGFRGLIPPIIPLPIGGPLPGIVGGIANGIRDGIGNFIGFQGSIFDNIGSGIAEAIGEGIGNALGGSWGGRDDWDDYYRKLAVDGVEASDLPPVEAVMAFTENLRAKIANNANNE